MSEINKEISAGDAAPGAVNPTTLKKDAIGMSEVLFQSITAMAPAVAVATALSPAVPFAGASLPLAVVMVLIACILIAANIELAIHIPSAGAFSCCTWPPASPPSFSTAANDHRISMWYNTLLSLSFP